MVNTRTEFRPYHGTEDLPRMREFLLAYRSQDDRWHVGDLVWQVFLLSVSFDPCENIRLWERDGQVLGFAIVNPRDMSLGWATALRDAARENELFAWAFQRYAQLSKPRGRLLSGALGTDEYNSALLECHGF